jgi:alpha/beta hydrolase family protein
MMYHQLVVIHHVSAGARVLHGWFGLGVWTAVSPVKTPRRPASWALRYRRKAPSWASRGIRSIESNPGRRNAVCPNLATTAVGVASPSHNRAGENHGQLHRGGAERLLVELHPDANDLRAVAGEALSQRVPLVWPDELVGRLGDARACVQLALANAAWWSTLNLDQRRALIQTLPDQLGNAEGIPALARHEANSLMVQRYLAIRDELLRRQRNGVRLSRGDLKCVQRMNGLELALQKGADAARQAGVSGPYLLTFDPIAFGFDGRAIVSFGADPHQASSVSWHIPGLGTTIDKLDVVMARALNHLRSTLQEDPTLSAASIAYIGYDAPNGADSWRVLGRGMARAGGEILYSDIRGLNATRDAWAADGSHFRENHLFGHSYGSTTVGYAGLGGRLGAQVRTITLIASPGVGPIRHATEFGIGNNVFVASSSRDAVIALGGATPDSNGRLFGCGLGMDPAMDCFGAQRVTAEFPAELDRPDWRDLYAGSAGTHNLYWAYVETGAAVPVRSESLANFGRIAAGLGHGVDLDEHRTLVGDRRRRRARTLDPVVGRPLRLVDDPDAQHRADRRHSSNPQGSHAVTVAVGAVRPMALPT